MTSVDTPLVSVCLMTYNHEKFIRQALEGVLMQEADFSIEVIVGEDCSGDGTRRIVEEFAARYPTIIVPIYFQSNVGPYVNLNDNCFPKVRGKFVAILEGDDYWTDPYKLQKQVDFLEANPQYSIAFHDYVITREDSSGIVSISMHPHERRDRTDIEVVHGSTLHLSTTLFRVPIPRFSKDFYQARNADTYIFAMVAATGRGAGYVAGISPSIYRQHSAGFWSTKTAAVRKIQSVNTFVLIRRNVDRKYWPALDYKVTSVIASMLKQALFSFSLSNVVIALRYLVRNGVKKRIRFSKPANY